MTYKHLPWRNKPTAASVTDQVVDDVSKGPNKWNGEEGNAEKNDVQDNSQKQVGEPYSSAVHHPRVGVHLAVSHAHIHSEQRETCSNARRWTKTCCSEKSFNFACLIIC